MRKGAVRMRRTTRATGDDTFNAHLRHEPVWMPTLGMGHHPVRSSDEPYDADYFAKYVGYADTDQGRAITASRVALVAEHYHGELLDVGCGSGAFIEARGEDTWGFDVNPVSRKWLRDRFLFKTPYDDPVPAACAWDVLEHLHEPALLLDQITGWFFCSLPIVPGAHLEPEWKHLRRTEHRWYWTHTGFVRWMESNSWELVWSGDPENRLGREDIGTFVFRRPT